MKKLLYLAIVALGVILILAPAALAQEQYDENLQAEIVEEQLENPQEPVSENVAEAEQEAAVEEQVEAQQGAELTPQQERAIDVETEAEAQQPVMGQMPKMAETTQPLPKSGGLPISSASLLVPGAALLLGSGILVAYTLRRR